MNQAMRKLLHQVTPRVAVALATAAAITVMLDGRSGANLPFYEARAFQLVVAMLAIISSLCIYELSGHQKRGVAVSSAMWLISLLSVLIIQSSLFYFGVLGDIPADGELYDSYFYFRFLGVISIHGSAAVGVLIIGLRAAMMLGFTHKKKAASILCIFTILSLWILIVGRTEIAG